MKRLLFSFKSLTVLYIFFLSTLNLFAQLPSYHWGQSIGYLSTDDFVADVEVDESGNVYVINNLSNMGGSIDFNPGAGITTLPSADKMIVIQKIDTYGELIWTYYLSQTSTNTLMGSCIDIMPDGKVLVGGYFTGSVDFDNSFNNSQLVCDAGLASFVLVIQPNGTFGSVVEFDASAGGISSTIEIIDVKVCGSNINYVFGFNGPVNLYLNNGTYNISADYTFNDVLLLQTNLNFSYNWQGIIQCDNGNNLQEQELSCDLSGNIYVSGTFKGTVDCNIGPGVSNIISNGGFDACVLKYDSNGILLYSKVIGGALGENGLDVEVDLNGNCYLAGRYQGTVDFDPNAGVVNKSSNTGTFDCYILSLDNQGNFVWVYVFGGNTISDGTYGLDVDLSGNVYSIGMFAGTVDFDNSATGTYNLTGSSVDCFLLKLSSGGAFTWAKKIGGTGSDQGRNVVVDTTGNVFFSGKYSSVNCDFDPGTGTALFSSTGGLDAFLIKLRNCTVPTAPTITPTGPLVVCDNTVLQLTSSAGQVVWSTGLVASSLSVTAPGTYSASLNNGIGCVSFSNSVVISAAASPTSIVTPVTATTFCQGGSVVLNANTGTGLSYQWKLNGTNITGAMSSSYTANASGSYTVTVTNASTCSSTSAATVVTVNALPTATIIPATATTFCQGGSVVLNANTGTGLTYQWFNNATAISGATGASYTATTSGSYTVVVTNSSSCSSTSTAIGVTVNALPTATITPASATTFCQGGSVVLNANTGTGLTYQWKLNGTNITGATSSSYTANASGSYTVVVTNASTCSSTSTATVVTVNALPTATITPATATTFCQGGSVVLNANTGTGLSYQWKLNGTNITGATSSTYTANVSGSYTVTVTNSSTCSSTSTATVVTVNALPTATITPATATTFCQGSSVVLNANTGTGLTYQWFNNASAISGATSASYTAITSGSYTVVVTNASTCSSTSTAIVVTTIANVDYFADNDGDGFGDAATLISTCVQPQGFVTDNTDCDDNDATVNSAATEVCNHIDDDCNGLIDDGITFNTYYADNDGDTFGDANNSIDECSQPSGYVTNNTDCNDNNANQNAASAEICNGEDDDCDGAIDNGLVFLDYYADLDSDGFGAGAATNSCVDLGASYVTNNTDCDDTNANTYLGATEICNTIDDNCDGQADEGLLSVYFIDSDGDIFGNPSVSILACTQPVGYTTDDTDCNDSDASINPGAEDIPANNIDENCDGQIDNGIFELQASINFYPNPTRSELNIQITNALVGNDMYIFDSFGKLVYKQRLLSTQTKLSVSEYADGNYIFRIGELVKRFAVEK